jgi:signal transduction histidine kinase
VPVSSHAVAEAALKQVLPLAKRRHIKLLSTLQASPPGDGDHPNDLTGDFNSLVQLMVILLDNAVKYSPTNSTVTLSTDASSKVNEVLLTIADHGPGLEKAALERAFDRFYRADQSRSKIVEAAGNNSPDVQTEGFGLGLSIAKMIADLHDGTVILTSTPGHGTTATISLPHHRTSRSSRDYVA